MIEDAELLRSYAQSRSEPAFAELVRRRIGLVYSVALQRTHDVHFAEDATQAVFADLARKAESLSSHTVLVGWLYRSAHYAATNIMRVEQSRTAREKEGQLMQEISAGDQPPDSWEKVKPLLDEVMSELDESDRDAILLRFFDGRSFADVGAHLDLTENAARMRVDRALDKLHAAFSRRDIKSTTAVLGTVFAQQAMAATPAGLAASVTSGALTAAASAVVASPAFTFFQIMTTTKLVTGFAGVVLTIAVLGTAYESSSRRSMEAMVASAQYQRSDLTQQLRELETRTQAVEKEAARLKQRVAEIAQAEAKAKAVVTPQAKGAKPAWDPVAEGKALLARHPELKQLAIECADASLRFSAGRILEALELTPEQVAELMKLMREGCSIGVPINGQSATVSAGTEMPWEEMNSRYLAVLGESKKKVFMDYLRNSPDRILTTSVASALCFTETPLTSAQADRFAQIVGESRATSQRGFLGELNWDVLMAKSNEVLSVPQLAVLKRLKAQADEQALIYGRVD
jgi:RNA polymerase sigma factor (sigma-70 family)